MITFPGTTAIGRILPKEAFYKRLTLSTELKEKFVSDIKRIVLLNSLTSTTLRLEPSESIREILVIAVELKIQAIDTRILDNIARQNQHKLIFLLRFEEQGQLALCYNNKLYSTQWKPLETLALVAKGFTLDTVWDNFLEQIILAGKEDCPRTDLTLDRRIQRYEAIQKLQKELDKAEKLARAEKQPKKRFELYQQVQELEKRREKLICM